MGVACNVERKEAAIVEGGDKKIVRSILSPSQNQSEIKEFLSLSVENSVSLVSSSGNPVKRICKSLSDFSVLKELGKGTFGQVYLVKDKSKDSYYALKILSKSRLSCQKLKTNALAERCILETIDHPFVIHLHYAFQDKSKLYLMVDYMPNGELFHLLRKNIKFEEKVAKFYAAEILLALQYLHTRNIIYRDLKPENVLIDEDGHLRLIDFGISKITEKKDDVTFTFCGTPEYIAPQVVLGKGYDQSADWFSFGSILFDMLVGRPPFCSKNRKEIIKFIATKPVSLPLTLSEEAQSLLKELFRKKPKDRIGSKSGAEQIKKHKFFADINFEDLYDRKLEPPFKFAKGQHSYSLLEKGDIFLSNSGSREQSKFQGFTYLKSESNVLETMSQLSFEDLSHEEIQKQF